MTELDVYRIAKGSKPGEMIYCEYGKRSYGIVTKAFDLSWKNNLPTYKSELAKLDLSYIPISELKK